MGRVDKQQPGAEPALPQGRVRRLAIHWHGALVDVVTLPQRGSGCHPLRSGAPVAWRVDDDAIHVRVDDDPWCILPERGALALPCGQTLRCVEGERAPVARDVLNLDGRMFHAVMIATAAQICVVAALMLQPRITLDDEAGAGARSRSSGVSTPGGAAPRVGAARFVVPGREAEEGERVDEQPAAGVPARRPSPSALEESLRTLVTELHRGDDGAQLREAIGDVVRDAASAPVQGAGFGGSLRLRDLAAGPGNGTVGAGTSTTDALRKARDAHDVERAVRATALPPPIGPVRLLDVPRASVVLGRDGLTAGAREVLVEAVRTRQNAVRSCYETWALTADAHLAGRLTLELTLRPDGRVDDAAVTASDVRLARAARCIERIAADWYLGAGLVQGPQRLSFPFTVRPRADVDPGR